MRPVSIVSLLKAKLDAPTGETSVGERDAQRGRREFPGARKSAVHETEMRSTDAAPAITQQPGRNHSKGKLTMNLKRIFLSLTAIACASVSSATLAVNVVDHDLVQPIYTGASALEMYYQPLLYVTDKGCVPYPAVDSAGNVSGGLKAAGSPNGDCTSSIGQVYSRYTPYANMCAIMYSWFMPKDMPPSGICGHRY